MPTPPIQPPQGQLTLQTPSPIQIAKYARNGLVPHAVFESELAASLNFAAAVRNKQLFNQGCDVQNIPTGSGTTRDRWRFASHTGPLLRRIHARVVLGQHNITIGSGVSPTVTLYIENADGSTVYGQASATFGAVGGTPDDTPAGWSHADLDIFGVPADTDVYGRFEDSDGGRLIAASVYEESLSLTAANGYVVPAPVSVNAPIYDARRETMYELATNLWKRGAAQLINWTVDVQTSPRTVSNGTAINIVDNAASGASGPSWRLDTRYCRTLTRDTVPCVFKVYAKMSGSSDNGEVWLSGANGGFLTSIDVGGTTAQWYSATVDLPADLDDYYIEISNPDATETMSVYAASLYQYDA